MPSRTTGALALRPTGNEQGGYFLYSLTSGGVINRNHWSALPVPADVITRVHTLARRAAANITLTFADSEGIILPNPADDDDDDADDEYFPPQEPDEDLDDYDNDDNDDTHDIAGVFDEIAATANNYEDEEETPIDDNNKPNDDDE